MVSHCLSLLFPSMLKPFSPILLRVVSKEDISFILRAMRSAVWHSGRIQKRAGCRRGERVRSRVDGRKPRSTLPLADTPGAVTWSTAHWLLGQFQSSPFTLSQLVHFCLPPPNETGILKAFTKNCLYSCDSLRL